MSNMNEFHNTRLGGMKQDILDFKNEFTSSIESLKSSIDENFNFVNDQFDNISTDIKKDVAVIVTDVAVTVVFINT